LRELAVRRIISNVAAALVGLAAFMPAAMGQSSGDVVKVYAAGSLKAFVSALAKEPALAGLAIEPTFASAGLLRARIEAGERPDLFLSADMAGPDRLAAEGRARLPPIAFARNRMCVYAKKTLGLTPDNLIDRLLAKDVKIRASTPVADPSGDYAVAIFERIDRLRPGAGKVLGDKAQSLRDALKGQKESPASLFQSGKIDAMIAYCSAAARLTQAMPGLEALPVPPLLEPHPLFGLVILADRPEVLRLALFLLSERGQGLLKQVGLIPLLDGGAP
jgi:ABC-type molybdate transport system substrate-binding protein